MESDERPVTSVKHQTGIESFPQRSQPSDFSVQRLVFTGYWLLLTYHLSLVTEVNA